MKVALDRPRKFARSEQSHSNVPPKYASARRFLAGRSAVFDPEAQTRRELASKRRL